MTLKHVAGSALLLLSPALAAANGPYLGVSGSYVRHPQYNDVDNSFGGKVYAGYRFEPTNLFLEASYQQSGKADVTSVSGVQLSFEGYTVGAGWLLPFSPEGSGLYLRAAYYGGTTTLEGPGGSVDQDASGLALAVGLQLKMNDWVGLRVEYESLMGVKDFANDENFESINFGLIFEFGEPARRAPVPSAASYGAAYPQPVPGRSYAPAAPMPVAPPAAISANTHSASLQTEAPLRTQPQSSSQTQLVLPPGTSLRISQSLRNADGDWVYAEDGNGHSGWISAAALGR